jgi:hypothetical protein
MCKREILYIATKISSETLQMLEEAHGKAAMKKMQIYKWHKHGHGSVNDDLHCQ